MTSSELDFIVNYFKDHPVFLRIGARPQVPVKVQLAVLVYRLAHLHDIDAIGAVFGLSGKSCINSLCSFT